MAVSLQKSIMVCLLYAATSTTISMTNKLVLSQYDFQAPFVLLACQLAGSLICVSIFKVCHNMNIGTQYIPSVPDFDYFKYIKSLQVAALFVANVGCAFLGLAVVDVPMFLCVRRLTTICIMVSEFIVLGRVSSPRIRWAVALIMGGTLLAGAESLKFNIIGYIYVMGNNILTAILYVKQKKLCDETGLKSFGLMYYNAITALPISLTVAILKGEIDYLAEFPYLYDQGFQVAILLSSCLGVLMAYATLLCTMVNSPLATSVTGNTKDIVSTGIGWALYGGFKATLFSVTGLLISFVGSGTYSYFKLMEGMQASKQKGVDSAKVAVESGASLKRKAVEEDIDAESVLDGHRRVGLTMKAVQ